MTESKPKLHNQLVVLLALCAVLTTIGFSPGEDNRVGAGAGHGGPPQRSDLKVIERYERPGDPIEPSDFSVRGMRIKLREAFSANLLAKERGGDADAWLLGLSFSLKNIAKKRVTFILFELQFPETSATGPRMAHRVSMGQHPKRPESGKPVKPLTLDPGDTTTYKLTAFDLEAIKQLLATGSYRIEALNKAVLRVLLVFFEDGWKWEQDYYYRPNPDSPHGYERIKPNG